MYFSISLNGIPMCFSPGVHLFCPRAARDRWSQCGYWWHRLQQPHWLCLWEFILSIFTSVIQSKDEGSLPQPQVYTRWARHVPTTSQTTVWAKLPNQWQWWITANQSRWKHQIMIQTLTIISCLFVIVFFCFFVSFNDSICQCPPYIKDILCTGNAMTI